MPKETSEFSRNDKYLITEYKKLGDGDYYLTDIGDKTFVVPYKYVAESKDGKEAVMKFQSALLDCLNDEEKKVVLSGVKSKAGRKQELLERVEVKYNAVINAHRRLGETKAADFSAAALEKYVYKLLAQGQTMCVSPDAEEQLRIYHFLTEMTENVSKKFKVKAGQLAQSLGRQIIKTEFDSLKKYCPKHWKVALLAGALTVGGYHAFNGSKKVIEKENPVTEVVNDTTYTDFMGKEHKDSYGNLRRMNELHPEIMATILAIEGYAEEAFMEGGVNPTKGSGFTVIINQDGSITPVEMGDKTTQDEDIINNKRYIEKEFISLFGDSVNRQLSDEEIKAGICAGYCWGTQAFSKSCFFQSIKDDENIEQKSRKISGFRKQPGLLKRGFLISQILNGNWTAEDLLDLPVYLIKGKGYVHCSIYTLDLHEYLPCKKDKNGKYLKDAKGNDIPVVCDDDFCLNFYNDSDKKILNKLIKQAQNSGFSYKTVRELMKGDMVDTIINKDEKIKYDFNDKDFLAQIYQQGQTKERG